MNDKEKDFSIADIIEVVVSRWYVILIVAILIMSSVLTFKVYLTEDTYTAYGTLYISNHKNSERKENQSIDAWDLQSSRILGETYMETLKTRSFLIGVSDTLDFNCSWGEIKSMMTVSAVNDTELISIAVTAKSPEQAYDIASAIIQNAPDKLKSVFRGGEVSIVDEVIEPNHANNKGIVKTAIIGFMAGFVLGVAVVFALKFFDRKIHKSEDVVKRYAISILGELSR